MTFSILDVYTNGGNLRVNMHELSVTQTILNVALEHADTREVKHVNLLIGEFSDEREESIRFYWNELAKGTSAQDAQLHFQRVDAEMKCLACELIFHPDNEIFACPTCGSLRLKLLSGGDVRLESIDVE